MKEQLFHHLFACPACHGSNLDWGESILECSSCHNQYRIIAERPVFHNDVKIDKLEIGAPLAHGLPQDIIDMADNAEGWWLELGSGNRAMRPKRMISTDYNLFPNLHAALDIHHLPFADNAFEAVVSMNVFEHLHNPDKAIAEIYRVLKPGGKVYIHTAFLQPLHSKPVHFFNATRHGVEVWFREFEQEKLHVSTNFHPGLSLAWLAAEIAFAAGSSFSKEQLEKLMSSTVGQWAAQWVLLSQGKGEDAIGLMSDFMAMPQELQEKIALGFEYIGCKPMDSVKKQGKSEEARVNAA